MPKSIQINCESKEVTEIEIPEEVKPDPVEFDKFLAEKQEKPFKKFKGKKLKDVRDELLEELLKRHGVSVNKQGEIE